MLAIENRAMGGTGELKCAESYGVQKELDRWVVRPSKTPSRRDCNPPPHNKNVHSRSADQMLAAFIGALVGFAYTM